VWQIVSGQIVCCSRVSVPARTCSSVPVCWSTEHQGPAVETTTTVMVVEHISHPYVEPVHCRWPCFPDCRCTSLEHCRQTFIHPALCQLSSIGSKAELFSRSFPDWWDCVNFCLVCKVASQIWLCHPIRSIIIIIIKKLQWEYEIHSWCRPVQEDFSQWMSLDGGAYQCCTCVRRQCSAD